jgi:hypothetical protein
MNHVDKVRAPKPGSVQAFDARSFPALVDGRLGTMILLTILVERIEGTVKAYSAIVPDTSRADPSYTQISQWVKANGNPLSWREAQRIWPNLEAWEYAR